MRTKDIEDKDDKAKITFSNYEESDLAQSVYDNDLAEMCKMRFKLYRSYPRADVLAQLTGSINLQSIFELEDMCKFQVDREGEEVKYDEEES